MGIGALSAWYHGALPGPDAVRQGLLTTTGDGAGLELMTQLTCGPPRWLSAEF